MQRATFPAIWSFNYILFLRATAVLVTETPSLGMLKSQWAKPNCMFSCLALCVCLNLKPNQSLTLLLQSGHDLDIREVLQFVSQSDGVVLHLWSTEVAIHGWLGTEGGALEAAAFNGQTTSMRKQFSLISSYLSSLFMTQCFTTEAVLVA